MCEFLSSLFLKKKIKVSLKTRAYDCIEILNLIIDGDDEVTALKIIPVKRFLLDLTKDT